MYARSPLLYDGCLFFFFFLSPKTGGNWIAPRQKADRIRQQAELAATFTSRNEG
jgi:hypothetical protein